MKKTILLFALSAMSFAANAQLQKSLVKSFPVNGAKAISLDLRNAKVNIKQHDKEVVEVVTNINMKNGTDALYGQLSGAGRYDLALSSDAVPLLNAKDRAVIKVAGKDLEEEVTYTVTVPRYMNVTDNNAIAFGRKKSPKVATAKKVAVKKAPAKKAPVKKEVAK